jgi:hypothetical protein
MITPYVPLVLRENLEKVGNPRHTKMCRERNCVGSSGAKCADFWLSGRHVADMSATFPAKVIGTSSSGTIHPKTLCKWYDGKFLRKYFITDFAISHSQPLLSATAAARHHRFRHCLSSSHILCHACCCCPCPIQINLNGNIGNDYDTS